MHNKFQLCYLFIRNGLDRVYLKALQDHGVVVLTAARDEAIPVRMFDAKKLLKNKIQPFGRTFTIELQNGDTIDELPGEWLV